MPIDEHVMRAIEACRVASLVFDLAHIEGRARALAAAARRHEVTTLFAVKACPHPTVLRAIRGCLDGFDVASMGEAALVRELVGGGVLSVADPSGRTRGGDGARSRTIVDVDGVAQVGALEEGVEVAVRVSASIAGRDPAIGAVLDGSGHRRSRFGVETAAEIAAIAGAARGRRVGVHVHHGPVTATSGERFVATARAAIALARAGEVEPAFINLGGAWHGIAEIDRALGEIRAALPGIEIIVEPGRALLGGAGFATGHIVAGRSVGDRELRVSDLSRICHLRWSPVELVARAPHPGTGVKMLVVGPTCFEEDALGEWTVEPAALAIGERIVLREVSGYAVGWNTSFGGIAPAEVVIV